MAFDPLQEDCHRLVLEAMRRNHVALNDGAYVSQCLEAYELNPDDLIVSDRDRAFHLLAKVAASVDYYIPFISDDAQAETEAVRAEDMIAEAAQLDPANWDAQRMRAALSSDSNEEYIQYMLDHFDEVEAATVKARATVSTAYEREYAADLARRPFVRWMNALSSRLLISGRYRKALDVAERSLAFDATDPGDVRYTALLAAAKLEYAPDELKRFRARHQMAFRTQSARRRRHAAKDNLDAWSLIAEMNSCYRAFDYDGATDALKALMSAYPHAAEALYFQTEFPDGVYARVNVIPGTTDELVLALSEATPLLQEGLGTPDSACFSLWIMNHELVQQGVDRQLVSSIEAERRRRWGDQ